MASSPFHSFNPYFKRRKRGRIKGGKMNRKWASEGNGGYPTGGDHSHAAGRLHERLLGITTISKIVGHIKRGEFLWKVKDGHYHHVFLLEQHHVPFFVVSNLGANRIVTVLLPEHVADRTWLPALKRQRPAIYDRLFGAEQAE